MTATDSLLELAKQVSVADVVDAMGRLHAHRCHILDMVSPTPERTLFGPAVTVSYFPTCHQRLDPGEHNFARLFYQAAGEDPEGKVLVLASNGHPEVSLGGGTKLSRVGKVGMAGVLADGRLRDFEELADHGFATYCRGEATRWGGDVIIPYQANVPVVISGVGILPGDYIFSSSAGTVAIPSTQVREVMEGAIRVVDEERRHAESIAAEDPNAPLSDER